LDVLGVHFTSMVMSGELRMSSLYNTIESLSPSPISDVTNPEMLSSAAERKYGVSLLETKIPGNPNGEKDFLYPLIVCAMACCHSIKVVGQETIGDPLDLKMFQFTNWTIDEEETNARLKQLLNIPVLMSVRPMATGTYGDEIVELGVVRSFEFASNLRRMSVITHRFHLTPLPLNAAPKTNSDFEVFVKGAPEVMEYVCQKDSIPINFNEQLRNYTHHGYRVLAIAHKIMPNLDTKIVQSLKREEVESNLRFLGFIVFENKVKPGTNMVIKTLNKACIRQVMCTGDNVLTSISVSKECGIVHKEQRVFLPKFQSGNLHEENSVIVWHDVDEETILLDSETLQVFIN
jgi:cation-transporting ATPase 13A3/4/5